MITPINAASTNVQTFRGTIVKTEMLNEAVSNFTRSERNRWEDVVAKAEKTNDGKVFSFIPKIRKIGYTIIKSLVINEQKAGDMREEVYFIRRNSSLLLHDREGIVRAVLETLENIYK